MTDEKEKHQTKHELQKRFNISMTLLDEAREVLGLIGVRYYSEEQIQSIKAMIPRINHPWKPLTYDLFLVIKETKVEVLYKDSMGKIWKKTPQTCKGWYYKAVKTKEMT